MGRKKSVKTDENSKLKVVQKPINYDGNVHLKVMQGNALLKRYDIKNSGTMRLFQGIGYFLSGSTINLDAYKPKFLSVGTGIVLESTDPTMTSLYNEMNINRILLNTSNISLNAYVNAVTIPLSTVIPFSTIGNTPITEIGLFSTATSNTLLARIVIPSEYQISLESGQSLVIEWDLVIQNSKENS